MKQSFFAKALFPAAVLTLLLSARGGGGGKATFPYPAVFPDGNILITCFTAGDSAKADTSKSVSHWPEQLRDTDK